MQFLNTDEPTDVTEKPASQQANDGGESLDALAGEAAGLDAAPAQAETAAQDAQKMQMVQSNAGELLAALRMARMMCLPILPKRKAALLAEVWTDDVLSNAAGAGAEVMALHNLQMSAVMGRYAPYIVLVGVLAVPVLQTRAILGEPEPKPADLVGPSNG